MATVFDLYHRDEAPAVPEMYWNVVSNEQRIKEMCIAIKRLIDYANYTGEELTNLADIYKGLEDIYEGIKNGDYVDVYIDALTTYLDDYIITFIGRTVRYIIPSLELDADGAYRIALTIPAEWDYLSIGWEYVETDRSYHITTNLAKEHVMPFNWQNDATRHTVFSLFKKLDDINTEVKELEQVIESLKGGEEDA